MVEMLNRLEFMLMGLRQMNINAVYQWFPKLDREAIVQAIEESPKFKIEGNTITLKSEVELYEEELQKDILKDLMPEENDAEDDDLLDYDDLDDLDLVKVVDDIVEEETKDSVDEPTLDDDKVDEFEIIEEKEALDDKEVLDEINIVEDVDLDFSDVLDNKEEYFESYFNEEGTVKTSQKLEEKAPEQVVEKVVQVTDVSKVKGSDIPYEELIRLIEEYNEDVEGKLNYVSENQFDVKVKAIKSFYQGKYVVKLNQENILDTNTCLFSLIHKKKGMEVAYLLVCEVLNEEILNYMLDNYEDEVVYVCPIYGSEVDFEVGLNEFYLKDTDVIFEKFLEHYVVVEEYDAKIKNLEVLVGSK